MGKLAEILRDQRPGRKGTAMLIDMAFGSPIYERLRKQAAEELGQWTEKRDVSGDAASAMIIINLNLGRQRVVEEKKAALARGEMWCE